MALDVDVEGSVGLGEDGAAWRARWVGFGGGDDGSFRGDLGMMGSLAQEGMGRPCQLE